MKLRMVAAVAMVLLFFSATPAFAASANASHSNSVPLNLGLGGIIVNAGNQHYMMSGGQLVDGSLFGVPLAADDSVSFSLNAMVHGLGTSGVFSLSVTDSEGHPIISGQISVNGEKAAAVFPLDTSVTPPGNCQVSCTSQIPAMFFGVMTLHVAGQAQPVKMPIGVESPYWSPFGGPIVITSLDSQSNPSIFLVVTYASATIDWTGVHLAGVVAGQFGNEDVNGYFSQVSNSHEDLFTGTETDSHTISFFGMSDAVLNALGTFSGLTTFSLSGSFDCSSIFDLPTGTCTATGASSSGSFQMVGGQGAKISGSYATTWSVPSITTATLVSATVVVH